jgi:cysteine desulfurase
MDQIYMDNAACTPVDPRVVAFAMPFADGSIGNPSTLHSRGLAAKQALEDARSKLKALVNAEEEKCIVFTSGVTEANNIAIRGTALRNPKSGKHVVASVIEHISVLNPMKDLQKQGYSFDLVPVDHYGVVDLELLKELVTKGTAVVSVMAANSEIGTIEPIREVSQIVHDAGAYLHVDATAAAGHIPVDVQRDGIDLCSISSNDLAGPQGAGALYVKPGIRVQPILVGGGQERGLRPGTENLFAIAGMGEAARLMQVEMSAEAERVRRIRDELIVQITKVKDSYLTGHPTRRLPSQASFRFSYIEGESIVLLMDQHGIEVSTGSACSSLTLEPSHVLLALGLKHEEVHGSMVLSLGRSNRLEQVPAVVTAVNETVNRLRMLSPLSGDQK